MSSSSSSSSSHEARAAKRAALPPPPPPPMARRARARFRGPAADSALGEAFLDAISIVAAVGFAADVSQCVELCGETFRAGDRGATNDMLVQSLRLQCGAREARVAGREDFIDPDGDVLEGTTQLIRAALLNDLPRVLQLIQLGAPLDLVESTLGISALHWASTLGHEHVAKVLLDGKYKGRGATVDQRNAFGSAPLTAACEAGHEAIMRMLLSRGAKWELQNSVGKTALFYAVRNEHATCEAALRALGAST
jgi:hypothetical protein